MILRTLLPADAALFRAIRLAGLQECPSAFASSFEEECDQPLSATQERLVPQDDRAIFGAFDGDLLVGVAGVKRELGKKMAHKAFIWGVYVLPTARAVGVGRGLIEQAVRYAATLGVLQVNLGVNANNVAAIALYERCGFVSFGLERGFLLVDGVLYDELHMVCTLTPTAPQSSSA